MLDIFETKDEKFKKLEKRIDDLERRIYKNFKQIDNSFKTMINILNKLEKENAELKKDRDILIEKHKELLKNIPVPKNRLEKEVYEKFVKPVKAKIKENMDLVQLVVKEEILKDENIPLDQLFELVVRNGKINSDVAARKLNVHPARVEEWAKILKERGLIDINYHDNKIELRKKNI
ncbi:MAG: hypothetical protein QXD48_01380 [Candidatus Aenigmatarchaeota archaeon]